MRVKGLKASSKRRWNLKKPSLPPSDVEIHKQVPPQDLRPGPLVGLSYCHNEAGTVPVFYEPFEQVAAVAVSIAGAGDDYLGRGTSPWNPPGLPRAT